MYMCVNESMYCMCALWMSMCKCDLAWKNEDDAKAEDAGENEEKDADADKDETPRATTANAIVSRGCCQ